MSDASVRELLALAVAALAAAKRGDGEGQELTDGRVGHCSGRDVLGRDRGLPVR